MIIYIVQEGDTLRSIANKFQVPEQRIMINNCIINPEELVVGQSIVISYPKETYVVQEGDTLEQIASKHGITLSQLYRNNTFLWDRDYIFPDEELVISYDTRASITTNAYAFPYINKDTLKRSLPYLSYLSILNYRTLRRGQIEALTDDTEIIELAKQFGVRPLMLLSGISFQGVRDAETIYEILLNPKYQETHVENMLKALKDKGYYGLNITITFLTQTNQQLYFNYFERITSILGREGYPVFVTIDTDFTNDNNQEDIVDLTPLDPLVEQIYLMKFFWGTLYGPPRPVSSITDIKINLGYVKKFIDSKKLNVAFPLLGYDWSLPYIEGLTKANAITLEVANNLAYIEKTVIQFDEVSKTPFFMYSSTLSGVSNQHIVWFVDARSFYEVINIVIEEELYGSGLWNIMSYCPQLWIILISNCTVIKYLPEP